MRNDSVLDGRRLVFQCRHAGKRNQGHVWDVRVDCGGISGAPYQILVSFMGQSFTALVGKYINGHYICIPALSKGANLSQLDDVYYNEGKLREAGLSRDLARSFAKALEFLCEELRERC